MMIDRPEIGDQLVAGWRTGGDRDRQAIARRLFDQYYPAVFSVFSRCGFPREESRDLSQVTFVRVFAALADFRAECTFRSWLFKIADRVAANAIRDRRAVKRNALETSLDDLMEQRLAAAVAPAAWRAEAPSPLDEVLVAERARLLHAAIGGLPEQMRSCLLLRLGRQLKYQEIAAILGIAVGTVKAHLFAARKKLRDALGYLDGAVEEQEED
jgi:RNA polymerase sigma-70 factor (ECF subfamily)